MLVCSLSQHCQTAVCGVGAASFPQQQQLPSSPALFLILHLLVGVYSVAPYLGQGH